jgi:hypothetical protein
LHKYKFVNKWSYDSKNVQQNDEEVSDDNMLKFGLKIPENKKIAISGYYYRANKNRILTRISKKKYRPRGQKYRSRG